MTNLYIIEIIVKILLWVSGAIQGLPVLVSFKIYFSFPPVKHWSAAWAVFIVAMISVAFRRMLVAATFDPACTIVDGSWIFDQVVMPYLHSILFYYFVVLKKRFFLKWVQDEKEGTGK